MFQPEKSPCHSSAPGAFEKSRVALPSWLLSFVLHGILFFGLIGIVPGLRGGIVGDPDGDFRKVGIYVGHSEDGSSDTHTHGHPQDSNLGIAENTEANETTRPEPPADFAVALPVTERQQQPQEPQQSQSNLNPPSVEPTLPQPDDIALDRSTAAAYVRDHLLIGPSDIRTSESSPRQESAAVRPTAYEVVTPAVSAPPRVEFVRKPTGTNAGPRGSLGATPFFGIWDAGAKYVYVIDCSGSMTGHNAIKAAKDELLASLQTLKRSQQFQVVFYNQQQKWLTVAGKLDFQYFHATDANRRLARQFIDEIQPEDGTQHLAALKLALQLHPDVLFFLTDGGDPGLSPGEQDEIRRINNGRSRIHCVRFNSGDEHKQVTADSFVQKLAKDNNGECVNRDVSQFDRKPTRTGMDDPTLNSLSSQKR